MAEILQLIREMREVQRALGQAALSARADSAQRMKVVELRRASNAAVLKVSAQIEEEPRFLANPELGAEFRRRFSEMRSKVAVFQAKWPAVLLADLDPKFEESAAEMRACNRDFDEWVAQAFRH